MGLDGGTIITRSDVLRGTSWRLANSGAGGGNSTRGGAVSTSTAYHPPSLDKQAEWRVKWGTCALSEQPLAPPVVADRLGALYNREAVLEWLLARRGAAVDAAAVHRFANQIRVNGAAREHLASLRDVFPVDLTVGVAAACGGGGSSSGAPGAAARPGGSTGGGGGGEGLGGDEPLYACPVTGLPAGRYTMVALAPCGHIVSQRALSALGVPAAPVGVAGGAGAGGDGGGGQCPVCGKAYAAGYDDVIVNGSAEQVAALRQRLDERKARGGSGRDGGGKRKRDKQQPAGQQQQQQHQQHQQQQLQQQGHGSRVVAGGEAGNGGRQQVSGAVGAADAGGAPTVGDELAASRAVPAPRSEAREATLPAAGKRVRIAEPAGGS